MTRIYDTDSKCSSCHEPGQFGWLYQCTQDHEKMIEEKLLTGKQPCMDYLDFSFRKNMVIRKGSAEARRDKLSFLQELTPEQMASYQPDQIATILRQREELKDVIAKEERQKSTSALFSNLLPPLGFESSFNDRGQRTLDEDALCQYKICQRCRPACVDRAFLSLNAVADGEITPTAAAGFGFESLGGRPVIDKDVVRHIDEHHPRPQIGNRQMMELLDEQIARMLTSHNQNQPFRNGLRGAISGLRGARQLPTVKNVTARRQRMRDEEKALADAAQGDAEAIASTPDLLGNPWPWLATFQVPDEHEDDQTHGQHPRQRGRATRIPRPTTPGPRSARRRLTDQLLSSTSNIPPLDGYSWSLFGGVENTVSTTSSSLSDASNIKSSGAENEGNSGEPSPMSLGTDHGVAMTEESIEARVPDVVTQV
ncbi:hypothetical protein FOQG_07092 [Fusarium oxysporum f. sp. raphani 54005]|uniref:Uncharacterized protein n=1 Tax=Fusarium oxysporum f. sp. raphani 54005 TaxID=1089458 RepID=X0D6J6_FUSOX|nr:hypothetical protein FOQG_07092 [Fusarium oxysporum f. sp. raphani 54005]